MVRSVPSIPLASAFRAQAPIGWRTVVRVLAAQLALMLRVRSERRDLQRLDERMLKDIGLSAGDVEREAGRKPWDLPRSSSFKQR